VVVWYLTVCEKYFNNNKVKKISSLVLSFSLLFVSVVPAFAQTSKAEDVLGISTSTVNPQIPATAEGPGFILPDSPLFPLDQLKQALRLTFALSPEAKAVVHSEIAGERMAELRYMLARNNQDGIRIDLNGISQNLSAASDDVAAIQLTGRDATAVAKLLNENIKTKIAVFDTLENQSGGPLRSLVAATSDSLSLAKAKVDDALPSDLMANEVRDDLLRQTVRNTQQAQYAEDILKNTVAVLGAKAPANKDQAQKIKEALENASKFVSVPQNSPSK